MPEPVRQDPAQAHKYLVDVNGVRLRDSEHEMPQGGIACHQLRVGHNGQTLNGATLSNEPALRRKPYCQALLESHDPRLHHPEALFLGASSPYGSLEAPHQSCTPRRLRAPTGLGEAGLTR